MSVAFIVGWLIPGIGWLLAIGWYWQALGWILHVDELVDLNRLPSRYLQDFSHSVRPTKNGPQLAVIVPACNEQASVEATLRSLLASEGIRLQILAVDDRSTDETGNIMERLGAEFAATSGNESGHSLQILHIEELPRGWLGKPHALATAARLAQAEWLLFTDGDVLFAPPALALALHYSINERADHVVLMPDWTTKTYGEAAMHGAIHALSSWTLRLWRVADPRARDFLGIGAFNLVRKSTYEALGGFESLRMEVLEDLRFGWTVKRAGYRQRVVLGPGLAAVRWSHGAWGVVRNLEKNLFALYRYNTPVAVLACMGLALQIVWPLAAIAVGGWSRVAGIAVYLAIALVYVASRKVTRVPVGYVVAYPFAAGLFLFAVLRSTVLALVRRGVIWRGTRYSLRELRAHAGRFW